MNLFVNTISTNSYLAIFNDKREIISSYSFTINGNESSLLIPSIEEFLKENELSFFDIKNIVLVNGPGSFTGVRTAVLVINTIAYITKAKLTPISYFELFNKYPIIKASSKRDSFFQFYAGDKIEIINNEKLEKLLNDNGINTIYGEGDLKNVEIIEKINYPSIINDILLNNLDKLEPLYLKKPNIC